ncbi:N-acetyltransferase [Virgisporangium aliadipatigenens]|uniref:N-acetyltransferase n=1 Tax=Virgisporangium aliadipatigenens TaxID=741659 RepID=A0A8J4DXF6_9ACTN|nr:GNAT family N-acetyltransferase [Virgisporangium aliadipatigenens]GIJ52047.1 N-acetyltransferase [Virgisporangium aliadipatigenens]
MVSGSPTPSSAPERLEEVLAAVEDGVYPEPDGAVVAVPAVSGAKAGVVGFTGRVYVVGVDQAFVDARLRTWDLGHAFVPPFLADLVDAFGVAPESVDMLGLASPLPGPPPLALTPIEDRDHPRVRRALGYRTEVRVWSCTGGTLILGRGLAGRREIALEVDPEHRGRGLGRALATSARHLTDGPLWAQIAPGNAASVRALLDAGFRPVGQEVLLVR